MNESFITRMRGHLIAPLFLIAAGCSDGTAPVSAAGEFVLRSVNEKPLPYTWAYPATSSSYTLRSQRITLLAGGTWTSSTSHVFVHPGMTRDATNGLDGGTYTFDASSGALVLGSSGSVMVLVGTVSGRLLAITKDGDRLLYER